MKRAAKSLQNLRRGPVSGNMAGVGFRLAHAVGLALRNTLPARAVAWRARTQNLGSVGVRLDQKSSQRSSHIDGKASMSGGRVDGPATPSVGITEFVAESADSVHHGDSSPEDCLYRLF